MLVERQYRAYENHGSSVPQVLENHTQVALVFESPLESDHVLFVVRVSVGELL